MNITTLRGEFFLIDFCAKNSYTHHIYYVNLYDDFFRRNNISYFTIVPKYLAKNSRITNRNNISYKLQSNMYGASFAENPFFFIYSKFVDILSKKLKYGLNNTWRKIFSWPYVYLLLKEVRKILKETKAKDVNFLFPTSDPLTFLFINKLIQINSKAKFFVRLVGAESRGSLGDSRIYESILRSGITESQLRIGYEVENYKNYLVQSGISKKSLLLAAPPLRNLGPKLNSKKIIVGFLGMAKERKGFELIPEIIRELNSNGIYPTIHVQGTIFPWEKYQKVMDSIKFLRSNSLNDIQVYEQDLSPDELSEIISLCTTVILPYDSSYINFGSALFYQCIERDTPVITNAEVGFANDVIKYQLGGAFRNTNEIPNLILNLRSTKANFENYRNLTHKWTREFLEL